MAESLSVPCKPEQLATWITSQRTAVGKLQKMELSGTARKEKTEKEKWLLKEFGFLKDHIRRVPSRSAGNVSICV